MRDEFPLDCLEHKFGTKSRIITSKFLTLREKACRFSITKIMQMCWVQNLKCLWGKTGSYKNQKDTSIHPLFPKMKEQGTNLGHLPNKPVDQTKRVGQHLTADVVHSWRRQQRSQSCRCVKAEVSEPTHTKDRQGGHQNLLGCLPCLQGKKWDVERMQQVQEYKTAQGQSHLHPHPPHIILQWHYQKTSLFLK